MVKTFGQNPEDAGSSPAQCYYIPCIIRLLLREFIIYLFISKSDKNI